jgi:hypothetical protein
MVDNINKERKPLICLIPASNGQQYYQQEDEHIIY